MSKQILALLTLFMGMCGVAVSAPGQTQSPTSKPAPYNDHPAYNLHDEHDKTDIYAIPLDSSEEEVNEELESLEEGYPPKKL